MSRPYASGTGLGLFALRREIGVGGVGPALQAQGQKGQGEQKEGRASEAIPVPHRAHASKGEARYGNDVENGRYLVGRHGGCLGSCPVRSAVAE